MIIQVSSSNSPYNLNAIEFSGLVNFPYTFILATGGGNVTVNLPSINSIKKAGTIIALVGDSGTTLTLNAGGTDAISENSGTIITTKSITGNKSFLILDAVTYITGIVWLDVSSGTGGGGTPIYNNVTYTQLVSLINGGNLNAGAFYLITDYQTASYIQYSGTGSGGIGGEAVHLGAVEPLLVQAISNSEISLSAQSLTFPNDIINYQISVPDGDYEYAASQGKGCIIYRKDAVNNIGRDYDWRNVVFRRWETVIGNGLYYSYTPVAGAASIDVNCFNNCGNVGQINIGSPLQERAFFGTPYWLDNTVFSNMNVVFDVIVNKSYGNTISCFSTGDGLMFSCSYNIYFNNIIACDLHGVNNINYVQNNSIIAPDSGHIFIGNTINQFNGNVCQQIANNNIDTINSNTVAVMNNNVGSVIQNNNMTNSSAVISTNNCYEISGNTCINITGNVCSAITGNSSDCLDNIANIINANTCPNGINSNVANSIDTNSCDNVSNNTCGNDISINSNTGAIQYNTCIEIKANLGFVTEISENIAVQINGNNNTGSITGNSCLSILSNTTTGNISNNTGNTISGNGCGVISGNIVVLIENNENTGSISDNVGYQITNNGGAASINQNNCYFIDTNTIAVECINNSVNTINNNTCNTIARNSGTTINNNTTGIISDNIVSSIDNNNSSGATIVDNSGSVISQNANFSNIANNIVQTISFNTSLQEIKQNNGYTIAGNTNTGGIYNNQTNVITNNSGLGIIQYNSGGIIDNNAISSSLSYNVVGRILSNTTNRIDNNTGSLIQSVVITSGIRQNNVNTITNVTETTNSDILVCNLNELSNVVLGGAFNTIMGQSVVNCTIAGEIVNHSFLDYINGKTITPTAEMNSGTPTKSMYQESDGKFYLAILTGGALNFSTVISN